ILMISPLPSINQAYSLLIQDEKQREIHVEQHPVESAFLVQNQQPNYQRYGNNEGKFKTTFESKKNNQVCNYCKKPGHTIDKCYRIIGFPSTFKFTKSKRYQGGAHNNAAVVVDESGTQSIIGMEGNSTGKTVTREQFSQLFQLLQQVKIGQQGEQTSEANVSSNCVGTTELFVNCFSYFPHLNCLSCFSHSNSNSWILDSGASEHMTFDYSLLFNIKPLTKSVYV
ncbi:hypothetical protein A4A49_64301, partial [Nicotiana attenuata]